MKAGEKKLLFIELITLIILVLNAFVISIFNNITMSIFLGLDFLVTILLVGFEKERMNNKKRSIAIIFTFTLSLLVIKYGLGLISGYLYSPYNRTFIGIIKNVTPILILMVISELLRYTLVTKAGKNNFLYVITILIFTLVYLNITTDLTNLTSLKTIVELVTTDVLVTLFENIALTSLSKHYGYSGALAYTLLMNLYLYIMPIIPGLGDYLDAAVMIAFPIVTLIFSNYLLQDMKKEDYDPRNKHTLAKIIRFIMLAMMAILVGLNSNLFRYWIAVIASGSMEPTIEIGDVIIVDKSYQNRIDELEVGDVLVFTMEGKIYTHRIIKVNESNGEYSFTTQGDRKGQAIDSWTVTKNEVVGVTRHTIKYVGLPAIWLHNAIERD